MLGDRSSGPTLGSVSLQPHQISAVSRLERALEEFGGSLLCDEVGMGKTFVALAVAKRFRRPLIVAPAALASMWRDALTQTGTGADFLSYERLSRTEPMTNESDLVILDEAHHARNPATRRYRSISMLIRDKPALLLTATPIHNRQADLITLLSLFLGSRACDLTEQELSRCIVRRERRGTEMATDIPVILPVVRRDVPDDSALVEELMDLPPPLPPREAGSGGALIGLGLVHQWASSEGALGEALRRRIARATAMIASLRAGTYPTSAELETWSYAEGTLQLGFAELLAAPNHDAAVLLASVTAHADALVAFSRRHSGSAAIDAARARILLDIRARHSTAKIVAFAQYAETVSALFRRLAGQGRVAMLTADSARVVGGKLSRDDAIARFAPRASNSRPPARAEAIDLLLTTDLMSEGVNLQDAGVVVHLDIPWTAARMEQRVGRVARMGSIHSAVSVYVVSPPASAAKVLRSEGIVRAKWNFARDALGAGSTAPFADLQLAADRTVADSESVPARTERLRRLLERWVRDEEAANVRGPETEAAVPISADEVPCDEASEDACAATVAAREKGFVAAGYLDGLAVLLTSRSGRVCTDLEAQIESCSLVGRCEISTDPDDLTSALRAIQEWTDHRVASQSAGVENSTPTWRRRLLNRIDTAIQRAPPHLRAARSVVAARARDVTSMRQGAAVEDLLNSLASSHLPEEEWLHAVAALAAHQPTERADGASAALDGFRLHALLMFRPPG